MPRWLDGEDLGLELQAGAVEDLDGKNHRLLALIRRSSSYRLRPVCASYACRWSIKYGPLLPSPAAGWGRFHARDAAEIDRRLASDVYLRVDILVAPPLGDQRLYDTLLEVRQPLFRLRCHRVAPAVSLINRLPRRARQVPAPPRPWITRGKGSVAFDNALLGRVDEFDQAEAGGEADD